MRRAGTLTSRAQSLVSQIAHGTAPAPQIFFAASAIIAVRATLEFLLDGTQSPLPDPDLYISILAYAHQYIAWLCLFANLILIAWTFLPFSLAGCARLCLACFPVILVVPPIDFIFTFGQGAEIRYGHDFADFWFNYLRLFDPSAAITMVSPGVRAEVFLVCAAALAASLVALRLSLARSLLFTSSVYICIFFYGYLPAAHGAVLRAFGIRYEAGATTFQQNMLFLYVPIFLLLCTWGAVAAWRERRGAAKIILIVLYPSRLLFYLMLVAAGFVLALYDSRMPLSLPRGYQFLSAGISVALLFVQAKLLNDVQDREVDRLSNCERPLVTRAFDAADARQGGRMALAVSGTFAVAASPSFVPFWLVMLGLSYLYSAPPVRLRARYPLSHAALALIGATCYLSGAALVHAGRLVRELPRPGVILYVFLAFFALVHIKDLKDIQGDRAAGIRNPFAVLRMPRCAAFACVLGFALAMGMLGGAAEIPLWLLLPGLAIMVGASAQRLSRCVALERADRIFAYGLALGAYMFALWLLTRWHDFSHLL